LTEIAQYGHSHSVGDDKNSPKALVKIKNPATLGLAFVRYKYAVAHHHGHNTSVDFGIARELYERAAARGPALGQNNLGALYAKGEGIPANVVFAAHWHEKSAAQAELIAQANLKRNGLARDGGIQK
jgi:uncharacterized protein